MSDEDGIVRFCLFKQKTAVESEYGIVDWEMCIRESGIVRQQLASSSGNCYNVDNS